MGAVWGSQSGHRLGLDEPRPCTARAVPASLVSPEVPGGEVKGRPPRRGALNQEER